MQAVQTLPYSFSRQEPLDRSLTYISIFVVGAHALFLLLSYLIESKPMPIVKPPERLIVKTINLNEGRAKMKNKEAPSKQIASQASIPSDSQEPVSVAKVNEEPQKIIQEASLVSPVVPEVISEAINEESALEKTEPEKAKPVEKKTPKEKPAKEKKTVKKQTVSTEKPKKEAPKKTVKKEIPKKESPKNTVKKQTEEKSAKKPAEKKEALKAEKKETKQAPVNKPDPKDEAAKAKQRKLLAAAQESIAKIDQSHGKMTAGYGFGKLSTAAPLSTIGSLHIDTLPGDNGPGGSSLTIHERSYRDEVAGRLKLLLKLPEHGEVKIKLTLNRSGSVKKLAVVSAQSTVNRSYIEKTVPTLSFPAFGDNFEGFPDYTFTISLSNE